MAKKKKWAEDELIKTFGLIRENMENKFLKAWTDVSPFSVPEQDEQDFQELLDLEVDKADFWNEESLKMRFISPLLHYFVKLYDTKKRYDGFFDKEISATVEGVYLQTKTDFMLAKGIGDIAETPYFHFQEYKRSLKSPLEPMAQLLEAFLIAQEVNKNGKPLYGAIIVHKGWQFVAMQDKNYGASRLFDCTLKSDLLLIVAILREFKVILERDLL